MSPGVVVDHSYVGCMNCGDRVGTRVVIAVGERDGNGNPLVRFRCDCGHEAVALPAAFRRGRYCEHCARRSKVGPSLVGACNGTRTVIAEVGRTKSGNRRLLVRCKCGAETTVSDSTFKNSKRCRVCADRMPKSQTHRDSLSPEHETWRQIKSRCTNPDSPSYHRYGGRGIAVCERWASSYEAFLEDMGRRPSPDHSIDRIDNDRGYEPGNCRWATQVEQARNTSFNHRVTAFGVTRVLMEWASIAGLHYETLRHRLLRGWHPEKALTGPRRARTRWCLDEVDVTEPGAWPNVSPP